jgi:hypothetical protein
MPFRLQILSGPLTGKLLALEEGKSLRFGRGPKSDVILVTDLQVSTLHFELAFANGICTLRDLRSTNGTYVNGQKVETATLLENHRIRAGGTEILVLGMHQTPVPAQGVNANLAFQGWAFAAVPAGWELLQGRGFRRVASGQFPTNVVATAETQLQVANLKDYVDAQIVVLGRYLKDLAGEVSSASPLPSCDEALILSLRHTADDGRLVGQRQFYVRRGGSVGILTLTSLQEELPSVLSVLESLIARASFVGASG